MANSRSALVVLLLLVLVSLLPSSVAAGSTDGGDFIAGNWYGNSRVRTPGGSILHGDCSVALPLAAGIPYVGTWTVQCDLDGPPSSAVYRLVFEVGAQKCRHWGQCPSLEISCNSAARVSWTVTFTVSSWSGSGACAGVSWPAPPDSVSATGANMPTPRWTVGAATDGRHAYVFGGNPGGSSDLRDIVRFDPSTNAVKTMNAILPTPRYQVAAASMGKDILLFGGQQHGVGHKTDVFRYDPTLDVLLPTRATLPVPRSSIVSVSDGTRFAYLLGGEGTGGPVADILVYDAAADVVVPAATLPKRLTCSAGVFLAGKAYLFGGWDGASNSASIYSYDPTTRVVTTSPTTLPTARRCQTAFTDGTYAYIVGGYDGVARNQILRFDPATESLAFTPTRFPTSIFNTASAWVGGAGYTFAGYTGTNFLAAVTKYAPQGPPTLSLVPETGYVTDGVHPDKADAETRFTFKVRYTSGVGDAHSVTVHVDGGPGRAMERESGASATGATYSLTTELFEFGHSYHFEASDGRAVGRLPSVGEFQGPLVGPPLRPRASPVVFLHGFDPVGCTDTAGYFGSFYPAFVERGWTASEIITVAYYGCESFNPPAATGITLDSSHYGVDERDPHAGGNEDRAWSDNHRRVSFDTFGHTRDTGIEHLAYHVAWALADFEARNGGDRSCVRVVAHSMGGLVIRYALASVENGRPEYPVSLCVENVVTLSSPHSATLVPTACAAVIGHYQCAQMGGGTTFYQKLSDPSGLHPDGTRPGGIARGSTEWTIVGSDADGVISTRSATTGMDADHVVVYDANNEIGHGDYFSEHHARSREDAATLTWRDKATGLPPKTVRGPSPGSWSDNAAAYDLWGCHVRGPPPASGSEFTEHVPIANGRAVTGHPDPRWGGCAYAIAGVPPGSTLTLEIAASASFGPEVHVTRVDAFGVLSVVPCSNDLRLDLVKCTIPDASGTYRLSVWDTPGDVLVRASH